MSVSTALHFDFHSITWLSFWAGDAVSMVTRLGAGRPGFDSRQRQEFFFLRHRVQTCSGAHPVSYPMGTGDLSPWVERPGREANHSPPHSAEIKNAWSYTSTTLRLNDVAPK